jgi:hypothetical protein
MLGLAIAWHCMRSGRVQEAGEWLVRGGEEAIAKSALAEAEEALESGYRNLTGVAQVDCGVVLGTVLLDQGRWGDAHALVASLVATASGSRSPLAVQLFHLTTLALGINDPSKHEEVLDALLTVVESGQTADIRLRAGVLAATLASASQAEAHLYRVLGALRSERKDSFGPDSDRFALLCAQLHYWLRDIASAEAILVRLAASLTADGPSMLGYNLQTGLGACRAARGDYSGALAPTHMAMQLAIQAGSTSKEAMAASNASLQFFRLGELDQALALAQRSRRVGRLEGPSTVTAVTLAVELGCLALLGRQQEMAALLPVAYAMANDSPNPPASALTHLGIADALWFAGQEREAIRTAAAGLDRFTESVTSSLGQACRWTATIRHHDPSRVSSARIVEGLRRLERVDMLDRIEIALSALWSLPLDESERLRLEGVAREGASIVPRYSVGLLARLGLSAAQTRPLSEHSHPTA